MEHPADPDKANSEDIKEPTADGLPELEDDSQSDKKTRRNWAVISNTHKQYASIKTREKAISKELYQMSKNVPGAEGFINYLT